MNRPYTPFDIIWIKNVTNSDIGQAYMDLESEEFILHFPTHHKGNVLSPKIDEIIAIHQNINGNKVFTHLVSPIDNIRIEENRDRFKYGRKVRVIAKTDILNSILVSTSLWKKVNFQGISQGNACEIANISNIDNQDAILYDLWNRFIPFFRENFISSISYTKSIESEIENIDSSNSVTEGTLRLITHYARERNKNIVTAKKKQALQNGNLKCEICEFSFIEKFGIEFIECHHKTPISQSGVTQTTLDDLSLVCANCHRMLHKQFDGKFLSMDVLKERIKTNS
ncbi:MULTISPECIES: HNH endonuclease [Myroides]|uniref:HNH endonuclease n=1 Tax=Myroides TaxID=76831 RepID=UPI002575E868|nr:MULTISPECIES: HNH endonuclease [Myroides]MDM1377656.1 HNH endonuclease [Myroides marinus]MDM1385140.1 HNH endonuclease [Myroides marinus]MDM1392140.1 HNH endonuclease [Myroides marinus]MEC4028573.1 HNH endonuclease [Myroides odoratimimus]